MAGRAALVAGVAYIGYKQVMKGFEFGKPELAYDKGQSTLLNHVLEFRQPINNRGWFGAKLKEFNGTLTYAGYKLADVIVPKLTELPAGKNTKIVANIQLSATNIARQIMAMINSRQFPLGIIELTYTANVNGVVVRGSTPIRIV